MSSSTISYKKKKIKTSKAFRNCHRFKKGNKKIKKTNNNNNSNSYNNKSIRANKNSAKKITNWRQKITTFAFIFSFIIRV